MRDAFSGGKVSRSDFFAGTANFCRLAPLNKWSSQLGAAVVQFCKAPIPT